MVATWTKTLAADKRIQASVRPADGSFATPQTLSGSGEDSDYSRLAIGPGGSATAVWRRTGRRRRVQHTTTRWIVRPGRGALAPSEATYSPKIGPLRALRAARLARGRLATGIDGTTTAVWLIYDGSNFAAQASTRPAGGAFGTPETLSDPGRSAEALEVAAGPDGIATAIWGRSTVGGIIARSATRPSGLEPFGPPLSLSDSGQSAYSPDVGVGPDGSAIGVWDRSNGANTIVQQASTQPPEFTLNAAKTGTGSGTVGSAPAGIDCGTNCAENYPSFTKVTLTATPEPGSTFEGWGGACSDATGDTCELTMLEDLDAVATFRAVPKAKISKVKVSGPKKVKKGRKATYKVRVTNSGDAPPPGSASRSKAGRQRQQPRSARSVRRRQDRERQAQADEQIDAGLMAGAFMFIDILPGDSAELDCGQPQGSAEPGLVYCTTGGTGEVDTGEPINDFPPFRFPPFPDCCDPDGDGAGTMVPNPGGHGSPLMKLIPRTTNDKIGSGDVMIQRVSTDGVETEFVSTLQYIFATSPALVSYDDGQGNSAMISYPFPAEIDGLRNDLPVEAGPDGDVVLDLIFWRPQRRPIPPETGDWIDIGELRYYATLGNMDPQNYTCEQDAYTSSDPNLIPVAPEDNVEFATGGGFTDLSADRPASPDNTLTYRLNLTDCLESKGISFDEGEARGFGFHAFGTPHPGGADDTFTGVTFKRQAP